MMGRIKTGIREQLMQTLWALPKRLLDRGTGARVDDMGPVRRWLQC